MNDSNTGSDDFEVEDNEVPESDRLIKPWDPKDIRITTKTFSLREIDTQISDGELDLAPDFQRKFVWDPKRQIRLIESIILGIPLPAFYFNQTNDGRFQVIDGVQRLSSTRAFFSDNLVLQYKNLEYLHQLEGATFSTIDPSIRRRFANTQIVAHVIEPQTPDEVKYTIFSRVNTAGMPLTPQEIRHAMSSDRSRGLLFELVNNKYFDLATNKIFVEFDKEINDYVRNDKRMADRELALRFCAFYMQPIEEYAKATSLDGYLLHFTKSIDKGMWDLDQLKIAFSNAMKNSYEILGDRAFRRYDRTQLRKSPLNRAVFESQAVALADYTSEQLHPHRKEIKDMFLSLFERYSYDNSVRFSTSAFQNVKTRIETTKKMLRSILND